MAALAPNTKVIPVRMTLFPPIIRFSNSLHVRHSVHTAIVPDDEVDLRIELCFEMLMAHEVLEAG